MSQLSISMADLMLALRAYSPPGRRSGRMDGHRSVERDGGDKAAPDCPRREAAASGRPPAAPRIVTLR
ncbi:hypothetical protein ACFOLJ_16110 [Rugamonas sp. CCM 8940]|uniref:hypothetical protein n=1 Tax=Rugamonas sp. CCM 8940 TaxID=2765359 RepID=UPI0018F37966|nr:hypothetical protein [Rugamonas sp. CCM 8940]MBJ7309105.1 hypothetical protein [Rugamonas sp. CCM 8940]